MGLAVEHGRDRCAVADVAGDDLRILEVEAREPGTGLCHVFVAGAVEAVLAYAVLVVIGVGQGVHVVYSRDSLVERGVEDGDLRDARQDFLDRQHAFEVGRVVQRCDFEQRTDLGFHLLGHDAALGEELSAVRHAVSDGLHLVERADDAVCGVGQRVEHQFDAGGVVGDGAVQLERFFADGLMGEVAFRQADAFHDSFREQFARCGFHVDHLILDRRAAAVQYQNYHFSL